MNTPAFNRADLADAKNCNDHCINCLHGRLMVRTYLKFTRFFRENHVQNNLGLSFATAPRCR